MSELIIYGLVKSILDKGDVADEPIFVPRSASAPEGDGYIIALIYRAATKTSELLILNARDIAGEPAAVLRMPRRVPAGFHGNFVPAWISSQLAMRRCSYPFPRE